VARIDFLTCFSGRRKARRGYRVQLGKRGRDARERGSEATEQRLGSDVRLSNEKCSLVCGIGSMTSG
jgi:hypothetical protein